MEACGGELSSGALDIGRKEENGRKTRNEMRKRVKEMDRERKRR